MECTNCSFVASSADSYYDHILFACASPDSYSKDRKELVQPDSPRHRRIRPRAGSSSTAGSDSEVEHTVSAFAKDVLPDPTNALL
ncbi:hypothetical protein EC988_000027 [Linderina pennispora]|nr:hypothetical protein EC988_000027 [Linderina pennispora]